MHNVFVFFLADQEYRDRSNDLGQSCISRHQVVNTHDSVLLFGVFDWVEQIVQLDPNQIG